MIDKTALEIESGAELERFDLGTVLIGHRHYTVLTGFEGTGRCFWCGGELKGKLKRYCYGHMTEYYKHFEWGSASRWALKRAENRCQNCGVDEQMRGDRFTTIRTNLEVHHIVPLNGAVRYFSVFNIPWNLIVFCHECHRLVRTTMRPPRIKTIRDSWEEAERLGQSVMALVDY